MTAPAPRIFTLRIKATGARDPIRVLRAWLKIGLRTFKLRCVAIREITPAPKEN